MSKQEIGDVKNKHEDSLVEWLDQLQLFRPKKRIHRDFADGVLLAEIINRYYPKSIEMHNYQSRFSFTTKMENWKMLNNKVLKKLNLGISAKTMEKLCNSTPGVIERILMDVRVKIMQDDESKSKLLEGDKKICEEVWYDVGAIDESSDTMVVPIRRRRRCNDTIEIIRKKVVSFDSYLAIQNELSEKSEGIYILNQKVNHLENLLKVKDNHIEGLQKQLLRKNLRSRKHDYLYCDLLSNDCKKINPVHDFMDDDLGVVVTDSCDQIINEMKNDLITS